jgi:hypothetical protein
MISGPELFFRYAQPPNLLGYCGPSETHGVTAIANGITPASEEISRLALEFQGAWPYLELIGGRSSRDPLDPVVVEAYWLGNSLLQGINLLDWGNSASDRFQAQAGSRWSSVVDALNSGGLPNHAFHVFCVYPWVGLLKEGFIGPSLEILDRCRIGWGSVRSVSDGLALVSRQPLLWVGDSLVLSDPIVEPFRPPFGLPLLEGQTVSLHWDFVCQVLDGGQERRLRQVTAHHMAIANDELRRARLEPSR